MSSLTFHKYWVNANREADIIVDWESVPRADNDQGKAQQLALLYVKCNQIYQKLQLALDYLTHPQKRRISRDLCVTTLARMLEIRQELSKIKIRTPGFFVDLLRDLKMTPMQLEEHIPVELLQSLHAYKKQVNDYLASIESLPLIDKSVSQQTEADLPLLDAIRIIQVNERGRQGKVRAAFMEDINQKSSYGNTKKPSASTAGGNQQNSAVAEKSAVTIQRVYRGYLARKLRTQLLKSDLEFLGIAELDLTQNPAVLKLKETLERRRVVQEQHEKDYQTALITIKEKTASIDGPLMKDSMIEQFRAWYLEAKKTTGELPELPSEEDWKQPAFDFNQSINAAGRPITGSKPELAGSALQAAKSNGASGKKSPGGAAAAVAAASDEQKLPWQIQRIKRALDIYQKDWMSADESNNFEQTYDADIIRTIKRKEVENEVKNSIYEFLRDELESVRASLEKDAGKGKGKGKGGKAKKKDKGAGGKKGKKGASDKNKIVEVGEVLVLNDELKTQLEQFVQLGIVQKQRFSDFHGDLHSIWDGCGAWLSPGDVRHHVLETLVLPLICEPELLQNVKIPCTIALCGPKGTGKFTLINAALQESKATLFNVTGPILTKNLQADQTAGGLLTNIFKFAKQIAPAVIYMDEVEAVFAKKAKEGQFDVRSLKKDLTKNLKALRPSDRVLFVGRSDQPWEADIKAMVPVFDRVIYTPKPDYSTRYRLWNEKLKKCDKPAGQVNTSLLASSSEGLTITQLIDTFHNVISKRTRNNQRSPLSTTEFLSSLPPVDLNQEQVQKEWAMKAFGI